MRVRSDYLSKETDFAGLPKAAMLRSSVSQLGWVAATPTNLTFDTVDFNFGSFVPESAGALMSGWIIQEAGIYEVLAEVAVTAGGQSFRFDITGTFSFPPVAEVTGIANSPSGIQTVQVAAKILAPAGSVVRANLTQLAPVQNTFASFDWLYIEKRGGRY